MNTSSVNCCLSHTSDTADPVLTHCRIVQYTHPPKHETITIYCCFEVATVRGLSNCRKNITQLQTYRAEDHADGHTVQVKEWQSFYVKVEGG